MVVLQHFEHKIHSIAVVFIKDSERGSPFTFLIFISTLIVEIGTSEDRIIISFFQNSPFSGWPLSNFMCSHFREFLGILAIYSLQFYNSNNRTNVPLGTRFGIGKHQTRYDTYSTGVAQLGTAQRFTKVHVISMLKTEQVFWRLEFKL